MPKDLVLTPKALQIGSYIRLRRLIGCRRQTVPAAADTARIRLQQLERELGNLYENLLAGIATPALRQMIDERETEKARLISRNTTVDRGMVSHPPLPTPSVLQAQFRARIAALRSTLDTAMGSRASSGCDVGGVVPKRRRRPWGRRVVCGGGCGGRI